MQIQRLDPVALQVQRNVPFVRRIAVPRFQGCVSIPHKISGSAGEQNEPNLRVIAFKRIGDTVANKEHILAARFAALLAFAVVGVFFMGAGVDRQGDGVGIDAAAAIGQGAVDLGGRQPALVGHWGQLARIIKFLQREGRPGKAFQLGAVLQLPLVGNVPGLAGGQCGSHPDSLVALPGIQIPTLAAGGDILGLGADGDGGAGDSDRNGLGDCLSVRAGDSNGQAVSALLHGCIRCHRQSLAVGGEALRQAGVVSHPLGFQGARIHILGGNGKGGLLVGNALIECTLLGLHRKQGTGDFADVVSLLLGVILNIADISGIHFRPRCTLLVGSQNGQIAFIAHIHGSQFDAILIAGGVEGTAICIQIGADNTGIRPAVGLQLAALQIHHTNRYGVILAPAGLNGATLKGQGSCAVTGALVATVKDGTVERRAFTPATANDLQSSGALDGQFAVVQIQRRVAFDLVIALQGQGGIPGELDGGGKGLVVPGHLAGDGFFSACRSCHQGHYLLCSLAGREIRIFRSADRTVGIDRLFLTVGFADALRRSIPGHAGNKPTVLGITLLTGIPARRPLCGRDVAAGIVMFAAFMRAA